MIRCKNPYIPIITVREQEYKITNIFKEFQKTKAMK